MMVVAGGMLAATSCSDYSDYNSVPEDSNVAAGQTLYENIKSKSNLKDFAAIIDKAGYADVLNASQSYTMWLPEDGSYDASTILSWSKDDIIKKFLKQHIAEYSFPVSGTVDERIITLNDKHHTFTNDLFDEATVKETNIPSSNGLIHIISSASPFYNSIYEHLSYNAAGCDSVADYITSYADSLIDVRNSVKGPLVNGMQTYKDTVWRYTNPIISRTLRAEIENEDSSYVMLMPTNKAWDDAIERISTKFKYITGFKFMDVAGETTGVENVTAIASLKANNAESKDKIDIIPELYNDSLPKSFILKDLIFSLSYNCNKPVLTGELTGGSVVDTLRSTTYGHLSNVEEILSHCGEPVKMSNGYVRELDTLCFKTYETYSPILSFKNPVRYLGVKKTTRYSMLKTDIPDELLSELPDFLKKRVKSENSNYVTWVSANEDDLTSNAAKPEFDFALKGTLATKYKIYVVFCPIKPINGEASVGTKPYYARFDLAYNKADGTPDLWRLNVEGAKSTADIIIPENGKFNCVELPFEFPITYYGTDAFPTLFISNTKAFATSTNRNKYEQELRIQGVYLVPEDAEEYVNNLKY